MGIFGAIFGGLARALLPSYMYEEREETEECCFKCKGFPRDCKYQNYGEFYCPMCELQISFDVNEKYRNQYQNCICNSYEGRSNYFEKK